jgi:2-polyprenyl-6-hydroxyphenyl methylase/3-demethylubiquinone-9 3-methyltransferase
MRIKIMPSTSATGATADAAEVERFEQLAEDWWNPAGHMALLHRLNPLRVGYIRDQLIWELAQKLQGVQPLKGFRLLDVGCGGGLLSEPLARLGASVTGIDEAQDLITVARAHAATQNLAIEYRQDSVENLISTTEKFDTVISMEVVEHVVNPAAFVNACANLVAPQGKLIMATINRTGKSFALAILGAEYLLRWVPVGTHQWQKFVKPSELARALRSVDFMIDDLSGVALNPLSREWRLTRDTSVNYMITAGRY